MSIWDKFGLKTPRQFFDDLPSVTKSFKDDVKNGEYRLFTSPEVKAAAKEVKNEWINMWEEYIPPVGKAMQKADDLNSAIKNVVDANNPLNIIKREFAQTKNLERADHLYVQRLGFTHHGLYMGNDNVMHYADGRIHIVSLYEFAREATVNVLDTPRIYSKDEVIARAYRRHMENSYDVVFNNCEHFVNWCRSGR